MNKKVLIIDDDPTILEAIKLTLELEDYKTQTVSDCEKAIEISKTYIPDVILLDLLLSGNNGCSIAKELKEETETKNIPIIMISAHPNAKNMAKLAGADDFIAKPFDIDDLLNIVKKHAK